MVCPLPDNRYCTRRMRARVIRERSTYSLTFREVYLRCADVRPDRPASFADVVRAPSVRCKPEDVVVQVFRGVVAEDREKRMRKT